MRKSVFLFAVAASALASSAARADFVFPTFTPAPPGLDLVGSPTPPTVVGGALRMTTASNTQAAAAWYNVKQNVANGFTTTFTFKVSGGTLAANSNSSDVGADGVAFVIQNNNTAALGGSGGAIGYGGIPNSLAVEADTFFNNALTVFGFPVAAANGDPNGNHVSIQSNGLLANNDNISASKGISATIPDLSDGALHTVRVSYGSNIMNVYVDDLATPRVTAPINLATLLSLSNGEAYVGLTSATGLASEVHDVTSWSFVTVPEPGSLGVVGLAGLILARRSRRAMKA